jgi:hypothetical protein
MSSLKLQAVSGLIAGAIAVTLVTAILVGAVASSRANDRADALTTKLEKVTNDLTALRDANESQQSSTVKTRATLLHNNDVLQYQNRVLLQKLLTTIRLLRAQGVTVPPTALPTSSPGASTTRPKVRHPASPGPTAPSPSGTPSPNMACQLVPALCTGFPLGLPTLLP